MLVAVHIDHMYTAPKDNCLATPLYYTVLRNDAYFTFCDKLLYMKYAYAKI